MGKNKTCKWCEQGQCWSHGQVERDPSYVSPNPSTPKADAGKTKKTAQAAKQKAPQMSHVKMDMLQQMSQILSSQGLNGGNFANMLKTMQAMQAYPKQAQAQGKGAANGDAKTNLGELVKERTGVQPTKDDFLYWSTQVQDKSPAEYVCILTILALDAGKTYTGQPGPSKKAAEANAAAEALKQLGFKKTNKGKNNATAGKALGAAGASSQATGSNTGKNKKHKPCKWCLQGQCWNHGQIEKPADA